MINNIVLHIPHWSTLMPMGSLKQWDRDINDYITELADVYTKLLFNIPMANVKCIDYPYSRFYCDVERLIEDPMGSIGQGLYYTKYKDAVRSYNQDDVREVFKSYVDHHKRLSEALNEHSLLIDCHSFNSEVAPDVDICLGYNEDETKPEQGLLDMVKLFFETHGYRVAFNKPYSNAVSPKTGFKYPSLMIEVNKNVYVKDNSFDASGKLYTVLSYLYRKILDDYGNENVN